ncbi:DNA damage-binding protein 1 [Thelohanellus kitauei]|uniref:DNA damage-binding protein 1 n=1 Tax=Thelohanellus kitauei TaxID=669202 RepID=A0A0C2MQ02_THEKT|nr:DNA damage-binding protein 1 [Thelohanellus kitauei]
MSLNYISTSYPPTAVTASIAGSFNGPHELYLVIAKHHRIEMYLVTQTGLKSRLHFNVYGKITNFAKFRRRRSKDMLIMLTDSMVLSILQYDGENNTFITLCSCCIGDRVKRTDLYDPILKVDPTQQYALVRISMGVIKLISLDMRMNGSLNIYDLRINELYAIDVDFLVSQASHHLHIGVLYKDRLSRNFRSYYVRIRDKELINGIFAVPYVEEEACLILPVHSTDGGVIILGRTCVSRVSDKGVRTVTPPQIKGEELIVVGCQIGSRRRYTYLLADSDGNLYVLSVGDAILLSYMGNVAYPSSLTYVDNGVVFIGSALSDSQLVRLLKEPENGCCVRIIDTFVNIGPIVDMEYLESYEHDLPKLVTCSGVDKWGSIRVLTNGVKIKELAKFPLSEQRAVFSLKLKYPGSGNDDSLLITNYNSTFVICENEGRFSRCHTSCFIQDAYTLYAGNVVNSQVLQVTELEVRLIDVQKTGINFSQKFSQKIQAVSCNGWYLMLASFNKVNLFSISHVLEPQATYAFEYQISSLAVSTFTRFESRQSATSPYCPNILAISFWKHAKIAVYSLPNFQFLAEDLFDDRNLIKSIQFVEFASDAMYLFAALTTGELYVYELSNQANLLSKRYKTHIGTYPITLVPFRPSGSSISKELVPGNHLLTYYPPLGKQHVFICTDRPALIHYRVFKISFSYTNKHKIESFCTYNSPRFNNCVVLLTNDDITIGQIGPHSSCGVLTVPIFEAPRKIAFQPESSVFGLVTVRTESNLLRKKYMNSPMSQRPISLRCEAVKEVPIQPNNVDKVDISSLVVIDANTYDPICVYTFPLFEIGCSIASFSDPSLGVPFLAVGTGIITDVSEEPSQGRVALMQLYNRDLSVYAQYSTHGPVYDMLCKGNKMICCISHSVTVLTVRSDNTIMCISQISNNVTSLFCKSLDDILIVGDLVRGLSVFQIEESNSELRLIAKLDQLNWITSIECLDSKTFLFTNIDGCVFLARIEPPSEDSTSQVIDLKIDMCFNVDQQVNVIKKGTFTRNTTRDKLIDNKHSIMFGTSSGMIGTLIDIPEPWDSTLEFLQKQIINHLESVGDIDYDIWRSNHCGRYSTAKMKMIDGDLIDGMIHSNLSPFKDIISQIPEQFSSDISIEKRLDQITAVVGELSRSHLN